MRAYYRDFVTGERHYTRARFAGWTQPTGPLETPYAIFQRRTEDLLIPRYLLARETLAALPAAPREEQPR